MANYVETIIYFQGETENIQRMLGDLDPHGFGTFRIDKINPMPDELVKFDGFDLGVSIVQENIFAALMVCSDNSLTIGNEENATICSEDSSPIDYLQKYGLEELSELGITPQTTIGEAKKQIRAVPKFAEHVALFDKYGACNYLAWASKNLGTSSWDAKFEISKVNQNCICINGATQWSSPEIVIKQMAKRYDVQAHGCAVEETLQFIGDIETVDGEVKFTYYEDEADVVAVLKKHGIAEKYKAYFD
ncbi:hypothetical protein ACFBZI_11775 [Moraxella sp. ZJ142]|uniref:DUF1281 family ferredoxin-like fold protein n=1 Tax=Moraxella marmotae TaxID=3344520 RepID=UPI0035D480C3